MATITKTTASAVLAALGALALPADGVSEIKYQQTDYRGDFEKHQVWVNLFRNDRERMLLDVHRNREVFRIVLVYSGRAASIDTANEQLGILSLQWFDIVLAKINTDPHLGNLARSMTVSAVVTDGGMLAGTSNPKAVGVLDCLVEYYTEN
jgi:hypothetical protein